MNKLCGYWISGTGSPPVRIFRFRHGYRISFQYKLGGSVTVPVKRCGDTYEISFTERMELAYDECNDRLLIAEEGMYYRDYSQL